MAHKNLAVLLVWPVGAKRELYAAPPEARTPQQAYEWGVARHAWPESVFVLELLDPSGKQPLASRVEP